MVRILKALSTLWLLAAALVAAVTVFWVGPRVSRLSSDFESGMSSIQAGVGTIEKHSRLFKSQVDMIHAGAQLAAKLPDTLTSLKNTIQEASLAVSSAGQAASETKEGASALVLPEKEIGQSNVYLQKTADQLDLLSAMVAELHRPALSLSRSTQNLSGELAALEDGFDSMQNLLTRGADRLQSLIGPARTAPVLAVVAGLGIAFACLTAGCFSWALAKLCVAGAVQSQRREPERLPRAA